MNEMKIINWNPKISSTFTYNHEINNKFRTFISGLTSNKNLERIIQIRDSTIIIYLNLENGIAGVRGPDEQNIYDIAALVGRSYLDWRNKK